MSSIDEFIVSDENRELFDRVMSVTQADQPVRMLVYGPPASGKTTLARARGRERDLLSTKNVMLCHAGELMSFLNLGEVGEDFLERAGTADVMLLDGFEYFFACDEIAVELCRLLLAERNRCALSTIAFSNVPFEELTNDSPIETTLESYERWCLTPLDSEGVR